MKCCTLVIMLKRLIELKPFFNSTCSNVEPGGAVSPTVVIFWQELCRVGHLNTYLQRN